MKQKRNRNIVNRYTVGTVAVLIVAVTAFVTIIGKHDTTEAASSPKTASTQSAESQFSFTGAPGWRQGPTNKTSMALFQDGHDCFTSIQHKTGTVDVAAEREKKQANDTKQGITSTPIGSLVVTLQSSEGQKQYQLHQYSASGTAGGQKVKGGVEFGYFQLPNGYLKIEGHCDTASQLPATIPALQAIKLNTTD